MHLLLSPKAREHLEALSEDKSKKAIYKAVCKALVFMKQNLRHPSLNTHEYTELKGPEGQKVFEAYVQQNTPGAYRIFWYYGPEKQQITIFGIVVHPNKKFFL